MMKNETQKNNEQKVSWWDQRKPGVFYNKSGFPTLYPTNEELVYYRVTVAVIVIFTIISLILISDPAFNFDFSNMTYHLPGRI